MDIFIHYILHAPDSVITSVFEEVTLLAHSENVEDVEDPSHSENSACSRRRHAAMRSTVPGILLTLRCSMKALTRWSSHQLPSAASSTAVQEADVASTHAEDSCVMVMWGTYRLFHIVASAALRSKCHLRADRPVPSSGIASVEAALLFAEDVAYAWAGSPATHHHLPWSLYIESSRPCDRKAPAWQRPSGIPTGYFLRTFAQITRAPLCRCHQFSFAYGGQTRFLTTLRQSQRHMRLQVRAPSDIPSSGLVAPQSPTTSFLLEEEEVLLPKLHRATTTSSSCQPLTLVRWRAAAESSSRGGATGQEAMMEVRRIVFECGLDSADAASIRLPLWMECLGCYNSGPSLSLCMTGDAFGRRGGGEADGSGNVGAVGTNAELYGSLTAQWRAIAGSPKQLEHFSAFRMQVEAVEKDIARTDRHLAAYANCASPKFMMLRHVLMAHVMLNFELGYNQGMSDALAIIIGSVAHTEVEAFMLFREVVSTKLEPIMALTTNAPAFRALRLVLRHLDPDLYSHLERIGADDLTCCFRWLVVLFKREFVVEDLLLVWDVIFAAPATPNFEVFVAAALLLSYSHSIRWYALDCEGLFRFINHLGSRMNVADVLARARHVYLYACSDAQMQPCRDCGGRMPVAPLWNPLPTENDEGAAAPRTTLESIVRHCLDVDGPLDLP